MEESERLENLLPSQNDLVSATMTSEKEILLQVLENSKTKREAALKLGIDPSTLWRKMKKHRLE
nr:helix-turn-helix domain-containing protein [uncultured Sphaerochaeta sp.]